MILLPNFRGPGPNDVICARGKNALNHPGNRRFREMIRSNVENYKQARTKLEKSLIVSSIVDTIRQSSPDGGFVKREDGLWFEVGDHIAREKCGQRYAKHLLCSNSFPATHLHDSNLSVISLIESFRDILHESYRSSTKAKMQRRKDMHESVGDEVAKLKKSSITVTDKMQELAKRESLHKRQNSDDRMKKLFNEANAELLQQIKRQSPDLFAPKQSDRSFLEGVQPSKKNRIKTNQHPHGQSGWIPSYEHKEHFYQNPKRMVHSYAYDSASEVVQGHHSGYTHPPLLRMTRSPMDDSFSTQSTNSIPVAPLGHYYPAAGYAYSGSEYHNPPVLEESLQPPPLEESISGSIFETFHHPQVADYPCPPAKSQYSSMQTFNPVSNADDSNHIRSSSNSHADDDVDARKHFFKPQR